MCRNLLFNLSSLLENELNEYPLQITSIGSLCLKSILIIFISIDVLMEWILPLGCHTIFKVSKCQKNEFVHIQL